MCRTRNPLKNTSTSPYICFCSEVSIWMYQTL
jgi:hypothetical protein